MYCTGLNAHGECGLGHRDLVDVYTLVPSLTSVAKIAAGGRHSVVVRSNGVVKGWGWNYHGRKHAMRLQLSVKIGPYLGLF